MKLRSLSAVNGGDRRHHHVRNREKEFAVAVAVAVESSYSQSVALFTCLPKSDTSRLPLETFFSALSNESSSRGDEEQGKRSEAKSKGKGRRQHERRAEKRGQKVGDRARLISCRDDFDGGGFVSRVGSLRRSIGRGYRGEEGLGSQGACRSLVFFFLFSSGFAICGLLVCGLFLNSVFRSRIAFSASSLVPRVTTVSDDALMW